MQRKKRPSAIHSGVERKRRIAGYALQGFTSQRYTTRRTKESQFVSSGAQALIGKLGLVYCASVVYILPRRQQVLSIPVGFLPGCIVEMKCVLYDV
jgi:hypothetical protein